MNGDSFSTDNRHKSSDFVIIMKCRIVFFNGLVYTELILNLKAIYGKKWVASYVCFNGSPCWNNKYMTL